MPRWDSANPVYRVVWLFGFVSIAGCVHPQTELASRLERRVTPYVEATKSASAITEKTAKPATKDGRVQPAVALQAGERDPARTHGDQSTALPSAIIPPPRSVALDRAAATEPGLPADSDNATLDAITANGQPLSLSDAIRQAFRLQPRLCAQLEHIAQVRGAQQIAFSAFLPLVSANYDVGEFSLGVGGNSVPLPKGVPGFNFVPGVGALPVGLNIGTSFELAELNVQWMLLDFGRRLGRYEQARLATDIAALQTGRAYQTVANEVAVAYYNVLRSQALRRTTQEALRRTDEELVDARKRQREGVVEREIVLRAEVQRAETLQADHAATESEFVALAALNLAIGLKCNQPIRVLDPPEVAPMAFTLADCLETAVKERREFGVIRSTVEIAVQGTRVARAELRPG